MKSPVPDCRMVQTPEVHEPGYTWLGIAPAELGVKVWSRATANQP